MKPFQSVINIFLEFDYLFFTGLALILAYYSWWWTVAVFFLWFIWRMYLMWDTYIQGVDYIVTMIRVMRKGKFVWKKTEANIASVNEVLNQNETNKKQ